MTLKTDSMQLECLRDVLHNETNDVYICQNINAPVRSYYTLIMIKDHDVAKRMLNMFEQSDKGKEILIKHFVSQDAFCLLFDYRQERPLEQFYMGSAYSLEVCEAICINLIMECLSQQIPYPLLYMILTQQQVSLSRDHTVFFNYQFDLTDFDENKMEKDCAVKCAVIIRELLREFETQKATSFELLSRKIPKEGYKTFTELYRDIRLSAVTKKKRGIWRKLKNFFIKHQDHFFRLFLFICILLAGFVLLMLLSQAILGDTPFLRFFFNPFKKIGTESVLQ